MEAVIVLGPAPVVAPAILAIDALLCPRERKQDFAR
jgi:hypothetical protein